ncbi:tyrosine-type recombinase/integrase [Luteolibacter marinus]|uniref:tyrosine-type recombinase/integrase n=1 Tax=Luteolibacter marinus TaxID=2776705 RepID=UPI001867F1E9|nr:site-specific integrase [Luteolibacter marinus]
MADVWKSVRAENIVQHSSGTYYLQAKVGGKKIRRSLKTKDLRIAKIKRDAALAPLRAALPGSADAIKSLGDALAVVEAREVGKAHLKPRTREYYVELFRILRETLPLDRAATSFTSDDAERWWRDTTKSRSATQSNNLLRLLRHTCGVIVKSGLRFDDPTERLKRMRVKKTAVESLPSSTMVDQLVAEIRSQRKAHSEAQARLVEFLAWSGCRIGEARQVMWSDVGADWLTVHGGEEGTKGNETRMVPINARLRAVIEAMRVPGASGRLFHLKSPREALKGACRRLGIPHMRVHDLRHLFATVAIERGVDIPTLAKWLGHKDGGVLAMKTYGHLRDEHSLAAAKLMGGP